MVTSLVPVRRRAVALQAAAHLLRLDPPPLRRRGNAGVDAGLDPLERALEEMLEALHRGLPVRVLTTRRRRDDAEHAVLRHASAEARADPTLLLVGQAGR